MTQTQSQPPERRGTVKNRLLALSAAAAGGFAAGALRQRRRDSPAPTTPTPAAPPPVALPPPGLPRDPENLEPHVIVTLMRERIYGAVSCLAALAVISHGSPPAGAWQRVISVVAVAGGLYVASVYAEWLASVAVYQSPHIGHILRGSAQVLLAAVPAVITLGIAGFGWLDVTTATWIAMGILIAELGFFALLAVRRTELSWWKRLLAVSSLIAIGCIVVVVKVATH